MCLCLHQLLLHELKILLAKHSYSQLKELLNFIHVLEMVKKVVFSKYCHTQINPT